MRPILALAFWFATVLAAMGEEVRLGYLALLDDPRFDEDAAYAPGITAW